MGKGTAQSMRAGCYPLPVAPPPITSTSNSCVLSAFLFCEQEKQCEKIHMCNSCDREWERRQICSSPPRV
eukprot:2570986-Rhodomonas_salina.2